MTGANAYPGTNSSSGYVDNGYQCARCGSWLLGNQFHQCTGWPVTTPNTHTYTSYTTALSDAEVERIAKRVVELLAESKKGKRKA